MPILPKFEPIKHDLPEGVPPLASFYLYMVTGCNLACRHCWITPTFYKGKPAVGDCVDFEALKALIAEAKPMGLRMIKLTGGEPMLHPQFREIMDYITSQGINMVMETNATLITRELAHHMYQNTTMQFMSLSIDGATPESHDWFRAVPGAFDAAFRGLDYLVEAGYRPQVIMCPYEGNYKEVDDVVRLAVEHGAGSVKFNPVTNAGRGNMLHKKGEAFGSKQIMELARYVRGELQARTPIPLTIGIPPVFSTIGAFLRDEGSGGACEIEHIIGLLGSGEMALCGIGRNVPEMVFGRIGKDSLRDVWINNLVLKHMRTAINERYTGICGDCIHADRCRTHCAAHNYLDNGALISTPKMCQDLYEAGEFPMSRRVTGLPIASPELMPNVVLQ